MIRMPRTILTVAALASLLTIDTRLAHGQNQSPPKPARKTYIISGTVGLPGVTMHGLPVEVATDANGRYSVEVPHGFAGTVTPVKKGYRFVPPSRTYSSIAGNYGNQDSQASIVTLEISGNVGLAGVAMKGLPGNIVTDSQGAYHAQVEYGWSGTVTPTREGYNCEPAQRTYHNVVQSHRTQDYASQALVYTISGTVDRPGVVMKGLPGEVVSDENGSYSAEVPHGFTGRVRPVREGYAFDPEEMIYDKLTENCAEHNYKSIVLTFTISGRASIAGVRMLGVPGDVVTIRNGHYEATVPYGWAGRVVPKKEGYTFEPASRDYSPVKARHGGDDYQACPETVVISDVILLNGEEPIEGVTVTCEPGGISNVTDSQGRYVLRVPYGWTGSLKLVKEGYEFTDALRYTSVTRHLIDGERKSTLEEPVIPAPRASALRPRPIPSGGAGDVLVIPTAEVAPEHVAQTREDMQIMLEILGEKLREPRTILGVLYDYGDFFGRDGRDAEAIYLAGYGALFVMRVDFPLSFTSEPARPDIPESTADPVWQRAREKLYAPDDARRYGRARTSPAAEEMTLEQFQEDLIQMLRHAANIRHVDPNENIIVTVVGQDAAPGYGRAGGTYSNSRGGNYTQGDGSYSYSYSSSYSSAGGAYGDADPYGYGAPPSPTGRSTRGSGRLRSYGAGPYGGDGPYGAPRPSPTAPTVLTIQVRKADVDAFAQGDIEFEQFQQKVKTFTY